jgi:hypothetical protein
MPPALALQHASAARRGTCHPDAVAWRCACAATQCGTRVATRHCRDAFLKLCPLRAGRSSRAPRRRRRWRQPRRVQQQLALRAGEGAAAAPGGRHAEATAAASEAATDDEPN